MRAPPCLAPALVASAFAVAPALALPPFAIDGDFQDWAGIAPVALDPAGDALTPAFDLRAVYAVARGSVLTFRFEVGATINLPAGDAGDGTLILRVTLPSGDVLRANLRSRLATLASAPTTRVPWAAINFRTAPTFAARAFEGELNLSRYGVMEGSTVAMDFAGADTLAAPISLTFGAPSDPYPRRSPDRAIGTRFRLASLNTLFDGFAPASPRLAAITRLLAGVHADIVCFGEQYGTTAADMGTLLAQTSVPPDAAPWNVVKVSDSTVASRAPLIPIPTRNFAYAGAVVLLPSGPVAVLTAHLSCCGYINSASDVARVNQARDMAATIADFRARALGPDLAPFAAAPIVATGDWNIVGSRTPVDVMESIPGPALRAVPTPHLTTFDISTWRGLDGAQEFWPGRLDILTHSPQTLSLRHAFALDSAELNAAELAALGLMSADSAASDHLLLVADFADRCPADLDDGSGAGTPDGGVTVDDLLYYLLQYAEGRLAADLDDGTATGAPDAGVTIDDLLYFLLRFEGGC